MKFIKSLAILFLAVFAIASCDDPNEKNKAELSQNVKDYLSMKMGTNNRSSLMSGYGNGNPANESFQRLYANATASGRQKEDSTDHKEDSVIYTDPWVSCAAWTATENEDGSVTNAIDYGDGCFEGMDPYKFFMKGRYEYTYRSTFSEEGEITRDTYQYNTKSTNYGGTYYFDGDSSSWLSNGESAYGGSSVYNSADQTYSGEYAYEFNENYSWDNVTYQYTGSWRMSYNEAQSVIEQSDYIYGTNDDYYGVKALTPLVQKYNCYGGLYHTMEYETSDAMCYYYVPYVSGIEEIIYKQGNEQGSFKIDYGNGECDSKITIIENGVSTEIDLKDTFYANARW